MKRFYFYVLVAIACSLLPIRAHATDAWWLDQGVGGSAGGGVPGVSGGIGDDSTMDYVWDLGIFEALPAFPRYYFSTADTAGVDDMPVGLDTNPCTEEKPCRTLAKAEAIWDEGPAIIVLDSYDTWVDAALDWGATALSFSTNGCGTGGATTLTDDPCNFIVASDPPNQAVLNCSGFDLSSPELFSFDGTGSGYIGISGIRTINCQRSPVSDKAIFQSYNANVVFVNVDVDGMVGIEGHAFGQGSGNANFILVNVTTRHENTALWDENCGGSCAVTALCENFGNPYECCGRDSANACAGGVNVGLGCDSNRDCPASTCTLGDAGDSQCGASAHVYEVGQGSHTILSDKTFEIDTSQTAFAGVCAGGVSVGLPCSNDAACAASVCNMRNQALDCFLFEPQLAGNPLDITIIGPHCLGPPAIVDVPAHAQNNSTHYCISGYPPAGNGDTTYLRAARTVCSGWDLSYAWAAGTPPTGILFLNNSAASTGRSSVLEWFQNSVADIARAYFVDGQFTGYPISVLMRGTLSDRLVTVAGQKLALSVGGGANLSTITVDADGSNAYDADNTAGWVSFNFTGTTTTTAAAVSEPTPGTNITLIGDFFGGDAKEYGALGGDDDAFTPLGDQVRCTDAVCDSGVSEQLIALPANGWLPTAVLGTRVTGFRLGTDYKRVGAR